MDKRAEGTHISALCFLKQLLLIDPDPEGFASDHTDRGSKIARRHEDLLTLKFGGMVDCSRTTYDLKAVIGDANQLLKSDVK